MHVRVNQKHNALIHNKMLGDSHNAANDTLFVYISCLRFYLSSSIYFYFSCPRLV